MFIYNKKYYKINKFGFKFLRCMFMFYCYISMDNKFKIDLMKGYWVY